MKKIQSQTRRQYRNAKLSGSFGGISGFLQNRKFKEKKAVTNELNKLNEVILHKPVRKNFKRRQTIVHFINFQMQGDLADMSKYKRENKGNKFILFIIDTFSRFLWTFPIKDKSGPVVAAAFKKFFQINKHPIRYIQFDRGLEAYNKHVLELFKTKNVKLFSTFTELKATLVERVIRTIKTRLERYFTYTNKHRYLEILPMLTESYNSTIHSAHGFRPRDINKHNESKVWKILYEDYFSEPLKTPKFSIGDKVVTSKIKNLFDKGYAKNWNEEPFFIHEIKKTKPIVYTLRDENNEPLQGTFYENQLQLVE